MEKDLTYKTIDATALLQRIEALEARIDSLFLSKAMNQEAGVLPLDEFDTHRFVHVSNWQLHEFTKQGATWQRGPQLASDLFFLINPSEAVKEQIELAHGEPIDWNTHSLVFRHKGTKHTFQTAILEGQIPDVYLYWFHGIPYYGRFKMLQTLRTELLAKEFEIEELESPIRDKIYPFKFHQQLTKFMNSKSYSATITVDFQTQFQTMPHIQWYVMPLHFGNMRITLQHLSSKQAIFQFEYGKGDVPPTTTLHWMATGQV